MKTLHVACVVLFCLFSININAAVYSGGDGLSEATAYQISSPADWETLMATPADWDKQFILTDNIDLAGVTITPVGNNTTYFMGTFDGSGHTISNLSYFSGSDYYVGLFGYTWNATIKDLNLVDVQFTPLARNVGALAGYCTRSTITNCSSTGFIVMDSTPGIIYWSIVVGGLVGQMYEGSMSGCSSACDIGVNCDYYGSLSSIYAGGLIGNSNATVTGCFSTGSVTVDVLTTFDNVFTFAGGFAGGLSNSVTNCYSRGTVSCASAAYYTTAYICAGGFTGIGTGILSNCYSTGPVSAIGGDISIGGFQGHGSGTGTACFWDTNTSNQSTSFGGSGVTGWPTIDMQMLPVYISASWDFSGTDGDAPDWYMNGTAYPQLNWQLGTVLVPDVVGISQSDAQTAITAAGLITDQITQAYHDTVPAGNVISQSPASGQEVSFNSPVNLMISLGMGATVPDIIGLSQTDAEIQIIAANLVTGEITQQCSDTVPAGYVISQSPAGGTVLSAGSAVNMIVSLGMATVPSVIDIPQTDAETAITSAGLIVGQITQQCSDTIQVGNILSQSIAAETQVCFNTAVDLVISSGSATVPSVIDIPQADAEIAITSAGLIVGQITQQCSDTIQVGNILSQSIAAETQVCFNTAVDLVVSSGMATVPYVIEMSQLDAEDTIAAAGLVVDESWDYNDTIPAGTVISQSPNADTLLCAGSWVNITLSLGRAIIVPDLTNIHRDDAEYQLYENELTLGTVRTGYDRSITEDYVSTQFPAAGQIVPVGTAIDLMVAGGQGWEDNPFMIWTPQQLNSIGQNPGDWGACFKLMADIDMSDYSSMDYNIIGNESTNFGGQFDGNGFIIRNLTYSTKSAVDYVGMFGVTNNAVIRDVRLEDATIHTAGSYAGALVGRQWAGLILRCSSTGLVVSSSATSAHAGGLAGGMEFGGFVTDCSSACAVNASADANEAYAGCLVGQQDDGTISRCYTTGPATSSSTYSFACAGGIAGAVEWGGDITACYSLSSASASAYDHEAYAGGITGRINDGAVRHSFSTSSAVSYSTLSTSLAGGLVGELAWGEIVRCYSTGTATASGGGDTYIGGLLGAGDNVIDSFWDTDTSTLNTSAGGEGVLGMSTINMQTLTPFTNAGWDFADEPANGTNDIWRMCADGVNYPKLNWQSLAGDFACPAGVDSDDLDYFFQRWLFVDCTADNNFCGGADMNTSGNVDLADFAIFASHWLEGI